MARARIVYHFGQLVERYNELGDARLAEVKASFQKLGLRVPFLDEADITTALAFLESIKLWKGTSDARILKGRLQKQRQKLRRSRSLNDIKQAIEHEQLQRTVSLSQLDATIPDQEFEEVRRRQINRNKRLKDELQIVGEVKPPVCKVNPFKSKDPQFQKAESILNGQAVVKVQVPNPMPKFDSLILPSNQLLQQQQQQQQPPKYEPPKYEAPKYFKPAVYNPQVKLSSNVVQLSQYSSETKTKNESRVRLTIQALDTIIMQPSKFHRIEFNDGKGHYFKRADAQDKQLYPHGEFFTACVRGKEHFFISLQVSKCEDCGMDANCMRRDCPVHLHSQFKIEHWYTKDAFSTGCNYRLKRIFHPRNKVLPHLEEELYLTPLDADNFNIYVQNALNLAMGTSCSKKLMGKSVPLLVLHALVQLRESNGQLIDLVDWREIIAELEIIPQWPIEQSPMRITVDHVVDGKIHQYKRAEYVLLLQSCVDELKLFYSSYQAKIAMIDLAKSAKQKKPVALPLYNVPKRAKYDQGRGHAVKWH